MRKDRFTGKNIFLDISCLKGEKVYIKDEYYHYLKNVKRVIKGTTLDAVIGKSKYHLIASDIKQKMIICDIVYQRKIKSANNVLLYVYQGLLKSKKMDFVVSKLSEIGAEKLFPLTTEKTVPGINPGSEKINRWERIAREGSKISGSENVMKINLPVEFHDIVSTFKNEKIPNILMFSTDVSSFHIKSILDSIEFHEGMVFHLFFGPEGGFSENELSAIIKLNGVPVSMGNFVLKSETAVIVGTGFIRLFYSGK